MTFLTPKIALLCFIISLLVLMVIFIRGFKRVKKFSKSKARAEIFSRLSNSMNINKFKKNKEIGSYFSISKKRSSVGTSRSSDKSGIKTLLSRAESMIYLGKLDEGKTKLIQVISVDNNNFEAYLLLTKLYMDEGSWKKAELVAVDAVKFKKENSDVRLCLGRIYFELKKYKEAVSEYTVASKLAPDNSEVFASLAELYFLQGVFDKSEEMILKALKLKPREVLYLIYLAKIFEYKGDDAGLMKVYEDILDIQPYNKIIKKKLNKLV